MLAAVSGVILAAQTLVPMSALGAANYGAEMENAYAYAYGVGVTTQYPIDNANMFGAMNRAEMAKMLGAWAEKTLGLKPDTSKSCTFTDIAAVKGDLHDWIIKSCQMGLMGVGISEFKPFDVTTRAQFGTVLSRAIWGDANNGGTPYYLAHLNALKNAGIMNQINDAENMKEVRGYVMIMLQRASENPDVKAGGLAQCKDPMVALACALETSECPAVCKNATSTDTNTGNDVNGMVKAGDLDIAVVDYSSEVKSAPAVATVIFNSVAFKASEKVVLESVKLERIGLSDKSAIKGVWFEKDGVAVSARASVTSDGTATTRFYRGFAVNGTENLDLVVELNGTAGSEIAFKFVDAVSSAKNLSLNSAMTTKYRTTTYTVAQIGFKRNGADSKVSYKLGERNEYEIGRFEVQNTVKSSEDKDILLKSLKLRNAKSADLALVLKNVKVTRDGKVVSKKVDLDSREMVVYLEDTLASGKKGVYSIIAEIAQLDRVGDQIQLELRKDTELVAYEKNSSFRVSYDDKIAPADKVLRLYEINGGKVTFTSKSGFPKVVEAGASSTDVEIANGTLTVVEPIKLEGLTVKSSTPAAATGHIKSLKIEIGGSTYTAKDVNAAGEFVFADDIYVSKTSDVKVLVSLTANATKETVKFDSIRGSSFARGEYETNGQKFDTTKDIAGIVQLADVVVTPGRFFLANKATTTQKVVAGNSDTVVLFDGEFTTNKERVSINDLTVTGEYVVSDTTTLLQEAWDALPVKTKGADAITLVAGYALTDAASTYVTYGGNHYYVNCAGADAGSCVTATNGKQKFDADYAAANPNYTKGLANGEQISLTLYVNGQAFSDAIYTSRGVVFNNLGDVTKDSSLKIKLEAQPSINHQGAIVFKLSGNGSDAQGNEAVATQASAVKLEVVGKADIRVANAVASSTIEKEGANAELVKFSANVRNGSVTLNKIVLDLNANVPAKLAGQEVYAEFGGKRIVSDPLSASSDKITFQNVYETLQPGTHNFVLKTNVNTDGENNGITLKVDTVEINDGGTKNLSVSKRFVKVYPLLSLVKRDTNTNEIIIKIENPKDSTEDLTITKFTLDGTYSTIVQSAALNNQTLVNDGTDDAVLEIANEKKVTLTPGESTELRLQVKSAQSLQLKSINAGFDTYDYTISDDYTNVANWADLKISYKA